jgi:acyl-CoA synthetase (AMP-forming)/AMP-acid ligase II
VTATLVELLERLERGSATLPFAAGRAGELTGAAFAARARRVAAGFAALGLRPGDRVAAFLEHDLDLAVFPFAAALVGAVSVIVNPRLKDAQVRHVVADADVALCWTSAAKGIGLADPVAAFDGRPVCVDGAAVPAFARALPAGEFATVAARVAPGDPATILYTSGSTGRPKGIVQSQRSLCDGARIVAGYLGLGRADHLLAVLPLSFDYGLNQVLAAAFAGCRVSLLQYLFVGEVLRALRERGCTGLAGVPEIWVEFCAALDRGAVLPAELRALRYVTNSGGRLPERVIRTFAERMPWVEVFGMYGLSEAFRSSFVPPDLLRQGRRGIGRPIPEVELRVVDPVDGRRCAPGEVGELVHFGACVADGYWRQPEATARRFRPDPEGGGRIGVFSGDLARVDADGFFELVGRADEQLKIGGYRVAPDEVVEVLRTVPGLRSAAAVGVPRGPDGIPALCVLVEAEDGAEGLEAAVREVCRRELPPWMVPAELRVVAALPRNPNQKVDLAAVRRLFAEGG